MLRSPVWGKTGGDNGRDGYFEIPSLCQLIQKTIDEIDMESLLIRVYDPSDTILIDKITKDLISATGMPSWKESYKLAESTETIKQLIDYVFTVIIAIMMFLCFFSLSASMSANLYD